MCDIAYAMLVERAERLDRVYLHAQLVSGVKSNDIEVEPHRERLDEDVFAPMGDEAHELEALMEYLRG